MGEQSMYTNERKTMNRRMAFLGCSRGLGRAIAQSSPLGHRLFCARNKGELFRLSQDVKGDVLPIDFSLPIDIWFPHLENFQPTHIYYFAGGGPFAPFHLKEFKDHEWTFNVNFKTPAQLIHWALKQNIQQFIATGSAIAESKGDANASSYAASKHALLGLCQSVWLESPQFDLRLFSPSYMDTDLLPPKALPRQQNKKLQKPTDLASPFWHWANSSQGKKHCVLE